MKKIKHIKKVTPKKDPAGTVQSPRPGCPPLEGI